MHFFKTNHRIIAAYGVGSGNAPALSNKSAGHLWAVFINFLNLIRYEHSRKTC